MKNVFLLLVFTIIVFSCGRDNNSGGGNCKNKESARLECVVVNTPNYGQHYAQEQCSRSYSLDKCY